MARMSVAQFLGQVRQVCARTDFVVRIAVWTKSQRQLKLRIILNDRSVIATYYNCENGKTAYAQLKDNQRIFGADNANDVWHWHPREDPSQHIEAGREISFNEFLAEIEKAIQT